HMADGDGDGRQTPDRQAPGDLVGQVVHGEGVRPAGEVRAVLFRRPQGEQGDVRLRRGELDGAPPVIEDLRVGLDGRQRHSSLLYSRTTFALCSSGTAKSWRCTSSEIGSSTANTSSASPRATRRPTCMKEMLTSACPSNVPIRPIIPGRSVW